MIRRVVARRGRTGAQRIAVIIAASLATAPARGADLHTAVPCGDILVTVWGVIAPVATFGLIKNLEAIPGVAQASFDLRHALATIEVKPGATVTDGQLRAAVRSASYTPREITRASKCPAAGQ